MYISEDIYEQFLMKQFGTLHPSYEVVLRYLLEQHIKEQD